MASETQTMSGNQNLNQLIEQGDWAEVVNRLKIPLIGLFVLIVMAVVGWGILSHQMKAKQAKHDDTIYQYELKYLAPLSEKKVTAEEAIAQYNALKSELKNYQGLYSVALRLADVLTAQGQKDLVRPIVEDAFNHSDSVYVKALAGMRLAALLEDMNDLEGAEKTLLAMASSKVKVMEAKIYLDLGRISLLKGDKEKAREHFEFVRDNTQEQEFIRMAKLYLSKI
ncbi:MAG: hypothetical protein Fur0010_19290 [Bdellovibrio sp.]